jgi:multidrug/hemolysin transport system ATP-binding protein
MEPIIEIKNLYKSFGAVKAVQDVSFRVQKGELFAFLGVNGAGKSTTISILCGQLSRDGGEVFVDGRSLDSDLRLIRRKLGVVFQNSVLDAPLSVRDNLAQGFMADIIESTNGRVSAEIVGEKQDFV